MIDSVIRVGADYWLVAGVIGEELICFRYGVKRVFRVDEVEAIFTGKTVNEVTERVWKN